MTAQPPHQKQSTSWSQFLGPILILLLAVGAAIFGVLWSSDTTNTTATEDSAPADDTATQQQPDASSYLTDIRQEFPEAPADHQEALAAARAESDAYILSEHLLTELLTNPEHGYSFSQAAAAFAVEHVGADWNAHAVQFLDFARQQFPDAPPEELQQLLQHEPEGPQFTAEQTEYALSQLN